MPTLRDRYSESVPSPNEEDSETQITATRLPSSPSYSAGLSAAAAPVGHLSQQPDATGRREDQDHHENGR